MHQHVAKHVAFPPLLRLFEVLLNAACQADKLSRDDVAKEFMAIGRCLMYWASFKIYITPLSFHFPFLFPLHLGLKLNWLAAEAVCESHQILGLESLAASRRGGARRRDGEYLQRVDDVMIWPL